MKVGTKSLLMGVHQILWHPITVWLAWVELYGYPNWKECVCIFIHDWGYWGSPNMDGVEGEEHPLYGATIANSSLDHNFKNGHGHISNDDKWDTKAKETEWMYYYLCLYHSRHYAKRHNHTPSKLCWADKLSIKYDPWWFYLTRAWLSGELFEYRNLHAGMGEDFKTHKEWFEWASERAIRMGKAQSSEGISFHPQPEDRI